MKERTENLIFELLSDGKERTAEEISNKINRSKSGVYSNLEFYKRKGFIEYNGNTVGPGKYRIIK